MPKFSIVIPCYNIFEKIGKCLESLEEQTFKDFEAIFIDDCSIDDTYTRLEEYKKNSKLNIILKKNTTNMGPGLTRNVGIELATGKYITFLDADDYFEKNALEVLNKTINESRADCVIFNYYYRTNFTDIIQKSFLKNQVGEISKSDALVYSTGSTCCKMYLLENIKRNKICFPNFKRNEDMPFNKLAISVSTKIYYLNEPLYNYVDNKKSLTHNHKLADEKNAIMAFKILYNNLNDKYPKEIEAIFIKEYLYSTTMTLIKNKNKTSTVKQHIYECEKMYKNIYKNAAIKYLTKFQKICIFAIKYKMICFLRVLIKLKVLIKEIR